MFQPPTLGQNKRVLGHFDDSDLYRFTPGNGPRPSDTRPGSGSRFIENSRYARASDDRHFRSRFYLPLDNPDTTEKELAGLRRENMQLRDDCAYLTGQLMELR